MSYISRSGNLASTPQLRQGDKGPYCYATVVVTDRILTKAGEWIDGPAMFYDVAASGDDATRLVALAERDGNIKVTFSGRYRVTEWKGEQGSRIKHEVRADTISVALRGQDVSVTLKKKASEAQAVKEESAPATDPNEPEDIFATGAQE